METLQPMVLGARTRPGRPSMIVLTDVDALALEHGASRCGVAMRRLAERHVPVVLVSSRAAAELVELQRRLGLHDPFLCERGRALHVPNGYFDSRPVEDVTRPGWNVIEFSAAETPPDFSRALHLLVLLYWSRREDGIVVGLSDRDQELLRSADVPIIIRNPGVDQTALREALPQAYCTEAAGSAGWVEAIVGHAEA